MKVSFTAAKLTLAACMLTVAQTACSEAYPSRAIRIVTTEPGTAVELVARQVAQSMNKNLGQPVVVDNRGIRAVEIVAKAPRDGYTLLVYSSPLWLMPLMQKVTWDTEKDFAPISGTVSVPNVLAVPVSLGVNSVTEVVNLARSKPGALNYGSGSTGSSTHLAAELLKSSTKIDVLRVPYKGAGPAMTALLAGEVQILFATTAAAKPHAEAGRLRLLAITTAQRSALAPGLPTVAEAGVPGYESASLSGMLAPIGTPADILKRLNQQVVSALARHDIREKLAILGVETITGTPEDFRATIKADTAKWAKVIKQAGIREE